MRIFKYLIAAGISAAAALTAIAATQAFDRKASVTEEAPAAAPERPLGADDVFNLGLQAYRSGDTARAVSRLEAAAAEGHAPSQWQLGKMYANGDGVARDPLKAFEYFRAVANGHAEDSPRSPFARFVSDSFVELGNFFREGIPDSRIVRNLGEAVNLFTYAATYFGDAEAQYQLARMYLDGSGTERNPRRAMRWLLLAAKKGHGKAQAQLGRLLLTGDDGVKPHTVHGLMWLEIARRNEQVGRTAAQADESVNGLAAGVTPQQRERATNMADSYMARAQ